MSQRTEALRARMWKEVHKAENDRMVKRYQQAKEKLDALPDNSPAYAEQKERCAELYKSAMAHSEQFRE